MRKKKKVASCLNMTLMASAVSVEREKEKRKCEWSSSMPRDRHINAKSNNISEK